MTSFSKLLFTGFIATQAFNFATATTDDLCYCVGECKSLADPHVTKFDGTSYDIYTEGETTLYNIGETYAVKSFVTKLNGTGESYFQNEVTIIKNGVAANKYIADDTEDCPYQTHKISNEFAIENPFNELTEYVKTTLECKRGPINCQGSECMNYFNVYIEKKKLLSTIFKCLWEEFH